MPNTHSLAEPVRMNWLQIFSASDAELADYFIPLRRYFANGFKHDPVHDRWEEREICLRTPQQTLFVDPTTGDFRPAPVIV